MDPVSPPHRSVSNVANMMQRRLSVSTDMDVKRVVMGRPARVFWDLENCQIAGKEYLAGIMRSIEYRVSTDTSQDAFEIYAAYNNPSHLPNEVVNELLAYDVNFNRVESHGNKTSVDDDLYEQIENYINHQSQRTHLFPYVLLIAGSHNLIERMDQLEKGAKVVYAIRKENIVHNPRSMLNHIVYEYTITKGIQSRMKLTESKQ